jgi:hypothetical protein
MEEGHHQMSQGGQMEIANVAEDLRERYMMLKKHEGALGMSRQPFEGLTPMQCAFAGEIIYIERCSRAESALAEAEAKLERLSAPVSHAEMQEFALHYINVVQPDRTMPVLTYTQVDALIKSRIAPPQ